jgi:hypothetical protein
MDQETSTLVISGIDTKKFLQGQLTCNVEAVPPAPSFIWGAQCNPQGRVICTFKIFTHNDTYGLQMPTEMIAIAKNKLKKYAIFFKVSLNHDSANYIASNKLEEVSQCIPNIYPTTSEKYLPHELNLVKIGAVSFTKGCFTGQEIIARMEYRGKLKKHLYSFTITTDQPLTRGATVYSKKLAQPVGDLIDFCGIEKNTYLILLLLSKELQQDDLADLHFNELGLQ